MTQDDVVNRIEGLDVETARAVVCALIGHSRVLSFFFGYLNCARCRAQVGDTLGGASDAKDNVLVDHDCDVCRKNAKLLTWKDTFLLAPHIVEQIENHQRAA